MQIRVAFDPQFIQIPPTPWNNVPCQSGPTAQPVDLPWITFESYNFSPVSKNSIRLLCFGGVTFVLTSTRGSSFGGTSVLWYRHCPTTANHGLVATSAVFFCGWITQRTTLKKFIASEIWKMIPLKGNDSDSDFREREKCMSDESSLIEDFWLVLSGPMKFSLFSG